MICRVSDNNYESLMAHANIYVADLRKLIQSYVAFSCRTYNAEKLSLR